MEISKTIHDHREQLGLSMENYGDLLCVSSLSIYNWERGNIKPRDFMVQRIQYLVDHVTKRVARRMLLNRDRGERFIPSTPVGGIGRYIEEHETEWRAAVDRAVGQSW